MSAKESDSGKANSGEDKNNKLGIRGILAYGMGNIAATAESGLKTSYHMPFLTEVAGLNAAFAGTISMFMTIWDAINDPMIGGMADRTQSKWGKYRPWMTFGILSWTVITIMMFSVPDLSESGLKVYYTVMLFLWSIVSTSFMVPWQSLNSVLTTDVGERNTLLTSRMFIGTLSSTVMSVVLVPAVAAFGGGAKGYQRFAAVVALISLAGALVCIRSAKKRDYQGAISTPPKIGFKDNFKIFAKNKPVFCLAAMLGFVWLNNGIISGINMYYHIYVTQRMYLLGTSALVGMVSGIIIIPMMPTMYKKIGRHTVYILGIALSMLAPISLLIFREHISDLFIYITAFTSTIGNSMINMTVVSFVPDCADYTELHHGNPNAGLINALVSFVKKFVMSFSTMIIGLTLTAVGYVGGMEPTPELINSILNLKIMLPSVLMALLLVSLYLFPINKKYGEQMRAELKEVRAKRAAEENK